MGEMRQGRHFLRVVQILEQRPCRQDSRGKILNAEPGQHLHMKMLHQAFPAGVVVKIMGADGVDRNL